jgi:hypothetical protein
MLRGNNNVIPIIRTEHKHFDKLKIGKDGWQIQLIHIKQLAILVLAITKGKPIERWGRKVTGLRVKPTMAELPFIKYQI